MCPVATSGGGRWCPTTEQLMILEEMFKGGVRTPNAAQIQQITAHLSHYGKVEGKNVFYWFQNHKARDRQKLRRRLSRQFLLRQQQQQFYHNHHPMELFNEANHHQQQEISCSQLLHHFLEPAAPNSYTNNASATFQNHLSYQNSSFTDGLAQGCTTPAQRGTTSCCRRPEKGRENLVSEFNGDDYNWELISNDGLRSDNIWSGSCITSRPPLKTLELFPITGNSLKASDGETNGGTSTGSLASCSGWRLCTDVSCRSHMC